MAKITVLPGIVQQFDIPDSVDLQAQIDALTESVLELQEKISSFHPGEPDLPKPLGNVVGNGNGYILLEGTPDELLGKHNVIEITKDGDSPYWTGEVYDIEPLTVRDTNYYKIKFTVDPPNDVNGAEVIWIS